RVCATQGLVDRDIFQWLIWRSVCKVKFLARRQTDYARHSDLLNRKVIPGLNQLLLPGLEFNFGAQAIYIGRCPCVDLIGRLIKKGLGGLDLSFGGVNASLISNCLKVGIANS